MRRKDVRQKGRERINRGPKQTRTHMLISNTHHFIKQFQFSWGVVRCNLCCRILGAVDKCIPAGWRVFHGGVHQLHAQRV